MPKELWYLIIGVFIFFAVLDQCQSGKSNTERVKEGIEDIRGYFHEKCPSGYEEYAKIKSGGYEIKIAVKSEGDIEYKALIINDPNSKWKKVLYDKNKQCYYFMYENLLKQNIRIELEL